MIASRAALLAPRLIVQDLFGISDLRGIYTANQLAKFGKRILEKDGRIGTHP
jgi:hypothetical protein